MPNPLSSGGTETLIPPLFGEPESRGWEEDEEYISSNVKKHANSRDRSDRSPLVRSRSRYVVHFALGINCISPTILTGQFCHLFSLFLSNPYIVPQDRRGGNVEVEALQLGKSSHQK